MSKAELCGLREPFKSYFEKLLEFDVGFDKDSVRLGNSCFNSVPLPKLDPQDAKELADELRVVMMPIIKKFTEKKLEMVHAMMEGAPPVQDIMEGRLI